MSNIFLLLLTPFKAIGSGNFYRSVLFDGSGVGLRYLLTLCAAVAVAAVFQVERAFDSMRSLELSSVVASVPASYVDENGILHAKNPADKPVYIENSKGVTVVVYNPGNLETDPSKTGIVTITAQYMLLNTAGGTVSVPWLALFGNGGDFEPIAASQAVEKMLNASFLIIWLYVSGWFFSVSSFVVMVSSVIGKVAARLIFKVPVPFAVSMRVSAYGSTSVVLLLVLQFFFAIDLSYILVSLIPSLYVLWCAHLLRLYGLSRAAEKSGFYEDYDRNDAAVQVKSSSESDLKDKEDKERTQNNESDAAEFQRKEDFDKTKESYALSKSGKDSGSDSQFMP